MARQQQQDDDVATCTTCERREAEHTELMETGDVTFLGTAYCPDCGRAYAAISERWPDEEG